MTELLKLGSENRLKPFSGSTLAKFEYPKSTNFGSPLQLKSKSINKKILNLKYIKIPFFT
ncbi:hypothetical protein LEP1GSC037_0299 [Leptospira interrogans str. 2006001854]|uniref:Uncharacterized protein n=1 Tax=Leptospira interrogans str. 2006001854 TaxID=1001590 RepID=M6GNN1_LEPIR|nr:hypothetical protein LEP1GSC037_0299 [Leptospira interrogans str. 2006001854]